jgi:hypothetical protein
MTDIPTHGALAAAVWARLEQLLIETGGLSDDERLRVARSKCIALLARAMEGLPLPPMQNESRPPSPPEGGSRLLPLDLGPQVASPQVEVRPFVHPRPVHELTRSAVRQEAWLDRARSAVGQGVWYDASDTLNLPTPTGPGPGYTCRGCGLRVKGARHTDPRLLCQVCAAHRPTTTLGH